MHPAARLRAILGGSAGNFIEWYDWFAYASFAIYFAKAFFPKGDQTAQLLQTAAVFAVGFFARPVGAWAFGLLADHRGRKVSLVASVGLMCVGSLIVALTPTYGAIGGAAAVVLTLARLIQGFSIGGGYGASATYMSEMAGRERRGFWSSFQYVTLIGGQLVALALLILLQHLLTPAQLEAWGWRIPFLMGSILALAVFFIQWRLQESAIFEAERARGPPTGSARRLIADYPVETAIVFMLSAAGGLAFYAFTTYMQKFLSNTAGFSKETASLISAGSLVVYVAAIPALGALSDRLGRRRVIAVGFGAGAILVFPAMTALARHPSPLVAFGLVLVLVMCNSGYSAVNAVVKAELYPASVRALGVALPYALGNAVLGGTAEYVALAFKKAGHESAFYIYVAIVMAIAAVTAWRMRDTQALSRVEDD